MISQHLLSATPCLLRYPSIQHRNSLRDKPNSPKTSAANPKSYNPSHHHYPRQKDRVRTLIPPPPSVVIQAALLRRLRRLRQSGTSQKTTLPLRQSAILHTAEASLLPPRKTPQNTIKKIHNAKVRAYTTQNTING